jgi:hypothetical protein
MAENSLKSDVLESIESISPEQPAAEVEVPKPPLRKLYFINEEVEWRLTLYIWTGCTNVRLRDMIMSHATELIRQIIRKQGLHTIYPGQDDSSFGDLLQTAWVQIERTLYKYRSRPHCRKCFNMERPADSLLYQPGDIEYGIKTMDEVVSMNPTCPKCNTKLLPTPVIEPVQGLYAGSETILYRGMSKVFNMWSQVARTVILAHIKKEGRDRKNSNSYINHLGSKQKPISGVMNRFLTEIRELNKFDSNHLQIINALEELILTDDRPYDGLIGKLVEKSELSRSVVTNFLRLIKLRSFELSDSLLNRGVSEPRMVDNRKNSNADHEEE